MPRVAFLTTDNLEDFYVYDQLCFVPLQKLGWQAEEVSWRSANIDWDQYDHIVIRSTWDYQDSPEAFLSVLEAIDKSSATLHNSLSLVKWNINKGYLRDLQNQHVPIVPTLWQQCFDLQATRDAFDYFDTNELVIKPTVSANADHTYRLTLANLSQQTGLLENTFSKRELMLQPFLKSVVDEGEYSLFYFSATLSHGILKVPQQGDFRVQEEHGGQLHLIEPSKQMTQLAEKALAALPEPALYARIDLIQIEGQFAIMEIELIEPSLYFNMDNESPARFAQAIVNLK